MIRIPLGMANRLEPVGSSPSSGKSGNPLLDFFGRFHSSLRVSLTDRCNLRCGYCMEEETTFLPKENLLKKQEIIWLVSALVDLGVKRVRLTGGEPLLRPDLDEIVFSLKTIPGLKELTLTTNGILLGAWAEKLKKSGLDRLTISLDTLDPELFKKLTRRNELARVLEGVEASLSAGFQGTSLNTVLLRGINDGEVGKIIEFAHQKGLRPRFIETMPIGAGDYDQHSFVSAKELLGLIREKFGEVSPLSRESTSSPARLYQVKTGQLGIIASVSEPFCSSCDRLRLTADGKFRACLFSREETDFLALIRANKGLEDKKELFKAIAKTVWAKGPGHEMHSGNFIKPARTMHSIGG